MHSFPVIHLFLGASFVLQRIGVVALDLHMQVQSSVIFQNFVINWDCKVEFLQKVQVWVVFQGFEFVFDVKLVEFILVF